MYPTYLNVEMIDSSDEDENVNTIPPLGSYLFEENNST